MNGRGHDDARDIYAPAVLNDFLGQLRGGEANVLLNFGKTVGHVVGGGLKSFGHFFGIGH
jgi:hypothetical protein